VGLRLALIGSPAWGYLPPARRVLQGMWEQTSADPKADLWRDYTLVHRNHVGVERAAGVWWASWGGQVETRAEMAPDLDVDAFVAFIGDRDQEPVDLMWGFLDRGIFGAATHTGRFPYRPGSEQWEGTHPAQLALAAKERRISERQRAEFRSRRRRVAA
jgi:hypothetical protein